MSHIIWLTHARIHVLKYVNDLFVNCYAIFNWELLFFLLNKKEKVNIPVSTKSLKPSQSEDFPPKSIVLKKSTVKSALKDGSLLSESYNLLVDSEKELILVSVLIFVT